MIKLTCASLKRFLITVAVILFLIIKKVEIGKKEFNPFHVLDLAFKADFRFIYFSLSHFLAEQMRNGNSNTKPAAGKIQTQLNI